MQIFSHRFLYASIGILCNKICLACSDKSPFFLHLYNYIYQCDELGEMFRHLLLSKVRIFCANGEYTSAIYALRAWRLTVLGVFNKTPLASYAAHLG
jgi:hypothetical protein